MVIATEIEALVESLFMEEDSSEQVMILFHAQTVNKMFQEYKCWLAGDCWLFPLSLFFIQWCRPIFRVLRGQGASFRAYEIILGSQESLKWADSGLKHIISVMLTNTECLLVFRILQGHFWAIWSFLPSEGQFWPKTRQNLDLSLCEILDFA